MRKFLLMLPIILACKDSLVQAGMSKPLNESSISVSPAAQQSTTINFSGYTWTVKSGAGLGPGPNVWGAQNVWLDGQGLLHLKLSYDSASSKWICAGVTSTVSLGYGTYQWQVQGPLSTLDKNVVAGLFHYSGPDGYNEMDVEFARWGDASKPNVNYSVYPAAGSAGTQQHITSQWTQAGGTASTHRYTWTNNSVIFKSINGFYNDDTNLFFSHTFLSPPTSIPNVAIPVKMNLWCFKGLAPSNGQDVEIVIRSFKFTPAP